MVPEHDPVCRPFASFMFKTTTGEVAGEHSVPLTIAVCPSAPHAAFTGVDGVGDGEVGADEDPRPPHDVTSASATPIAAALLLILV
jgi:hypothetical protein